MIEIILSVEYVLERMRNNFDKKSKSIFITDEISIKKSIRYKTFKNKGVCCEECGAYPKYVKFTHNIECPGKWYYEFIGTRRDNKPFSITVDHIVPKSLGGSNRIENLRPLCNACNSRKGNKQIVNILKIYNIDEIFDELEHLTNKNSKIIDVFKRYLRMKVSDNNFMISEFEMEKLIKSINRKYDIGIDIHDFKPRLVPSEI